jgi:hypothetical protein
MKPTTKETAEEREQISVSSELSTQRSTKEMAHCAWRARAAMPQMKRTAKRCLVLHRPAPAAYAIAVLNSKSTEATYNRVG